MAIAIANTDKNFFILEDEVSNTDAFGIGKNINFVAMSDNLARCIPNVKMQLGVFEMENTEL